MMSELKNIDDAINQVANAQQLIDFLDTDKKLTTKELEEQNSLIKSLEQEYNTLANIENKQSEYYLKTLEEILDREEEREKTAKENAYLLASQYSNTIAQDYIDQLQDLSEKTDEESLKAASALRKNLTLAIEEVGTTAREYSQSLTDDLLSDMASIVRKNINMADAVAAIKDGFKIESDDLETVFSAFPELAMDATVLKNGLLQLNSDVVEAVLGGQAEILDGERELALFKTQERLKELKEEIEQQQQIIEEARAVNGDKTKLINLLNKVYDKNTNIQIKRTAKESEVRIENDNNVTQQVIQNWQKMQRAAITYSQTAQAAMAGKFDEASQVSRIQDYITDEVEIKNKIDFEISDFDSTEIDN